MRSYILDRIRHLFVDERGFLGTGAAIAFGVMTGAQVYQAHRQSSNDRRAIDEQARLEREAREEAARQADRDREFAQWQAQRAESARQEAMAFDQQRWQDYLSAMQPYWQVGQQAQGQLAQLAGLSPGAAPRPSMAPATAPPPGQVLAAAQLAPAPVRPPAALPPPGPHSGAPATLSALAAPVRPAYAPEPSRLTRPRPQPITSPMGQLMQLYQLSGLTGFRPPAGVGTYSPTPA